VKLRVTAIIALAAIAIGVWLLLKPDGNDAAAVTPVTNAPGEEVETRTAVAGSPSAEVPARGASQASPGGEAQVHIDWNRIADMVAGRANNKTTLSDANIADFLRKRGETAMNLLAVWESTQDRKWLDRALELHPNDPALLLAAVGATPAPGNLAQLIQRLKTATPDNPLAWIFDARRQLGEKHSAEALAELEIGLAKPGFYIYASERILAGKQLYMDAGLDPIAAEYLAMSQIQLPHLQAARDTVRGMKEATDFETASAENRAQIIKLSYEMGRMFATPEASRTLIGQLVGVAIEKDALTLAQSQQTNPLPADPALRLAELERFRSGVRDLTSMNEKLMTRNDAALFAEYMRRFRNEGEAAALRWVGEQVR
jgi:hypothetical protein